MTIEKKGFPLTLECEQCGRRVPFLHLILVRIKGEWKTDSKAVCDTCHANHEVDFKQLQADFKNWKEKHAK